MIQIANKEQQLKILEDEIEHSKNRAEIHWMTVAKDLCKIRDGKLHSQQTFEQYCLQRWGFKRSRAHQLCHTYEALKESKKSTTGGQLTQMSERAARELADVPPEKRTEVLDEAKASGKVSGKSVRESAKKNAPTTTDVIEKDREGRDIPEPAMIIWNRRNELKPKLRVLSELKQWATDMQDNQDLLFVDLRFNDLVRQIEVVETTIKRGVPHAVCTKCQGDSAKIFHCDFCKGRGMISAYQYHGMPYTPEEMKKIIEKRTSKNDSAKKLPVSGR